MSLYRDGSGAPPGDRGLLRKTIRKKIVEILKNNTDAGANVFPNASIPLAQETELPAILVYPRSEPVSKFNQASRELLREVEFFLEIVAEGPEENATLGTPESGVKSLEDILDDIGEQIECEMSRDETLGGTCDDSILTNYEFEFDSAGSVAMGSARLTYSVSYTTMSPRDVEKQGVTDDFSKAHIDYDINDDDTTIEANDELDIPTS